MSGASPIPADSARKPEAWAIVQRNRAKAQRRGNLDSKAPMAVVGNAQTSPSMAAPSAARTMPGRLPSANSRYSGWVLASRRKRPPSAGDLTVQRQARTYARRCRTARFRPVPARRVRRWRQRLVGGADGLAKWRCSASATGARRPSDHAGPSSTPPIGVPAGAEADRDSETGHVAEVGEIGERAQAAVGPSGSASTSARVGQNGSGGQQQGIVLREQRGGLPAGLLQQVKGVERIDRQPAQAQFQDRPCGGIQNVRLLPRSRCAGPRFVRPPMGLRKAGGRLPETEPISIGTAFRNAPAC